MRKFAIATIALFAIIANTNSLYGQSYPWSAETTPSNQYIQRTQIPSAPAENVTMDARRLQQRVPQAPSMKPNPILASMRKQAQDQSQPSLSDIQGEFEFENAPQQAPPNAAGGNQSVVDQQFPPLTVQSTASELPNYCCRNCKRRTCDLGCIKRVFGKSPGGLEIGGWASAGYHNRDTIIFNDRKGTVNPHQVYLYAQKEAARNANWSLGFRTDLLYGIDAQNTQAFGNPVTGAPTAWDNSWDYGEFGWALPQTYVQFANCNWDVKVGKFYAPFGYEKFQATENFFYSHSYTFGFVQPRTLSGVLGEKQVRDNFRFHIGATVGWDSAFKMNDDGGTLVTGFDAQLNSNVLLSASSSYGDTGYRGTGTLNTGTAQLRLTENVQYVLTGSVLNLRENNEFAFTQYLFRDISCCLGLGARIEWWKSDQIFPDTKSTWEFTMGANYRPKANIVFRPEVRWDWGAAALDPGAAIVGIDAVVLY